LSGYREPAVRILFLASEVAPFSKTGGLADVAGALPRALAGLGNHVLVCTPRYRGVEPPRARAGHRVQFQFIEHPEYFDRPGLYGENGRDYEDNDVRFAFFARASLEAARDRAFDPEIIHLNDWQAALAAFIARRELPFPNARVVFTIHNLVYQGVFPRQTLARVGIPKDAFDYRALEFHGKVSYMKAGLVFADAITTVSPGYACEIQTPEFGAGLDGVLRERAARGELYGIVNGADYEEWSPQRDRYLRSHYSSKNLAGKARNKRSLQRRLGLEERPDLPVLGVVSRLDFQKGIDLVADITGELVAADAQVAILATGEPALERRLVELSLLHHSRFSAIIDFNYELAHLIQAGSDILLMPSRWEPCGLNQMYALRYGTVPVVAAVGGLDDTVEEGVTGFKFVQHRDVEGSRAALLRAIRSAVGFYRADRAGWRKMMRRGMAKDFSWSASAKEYVRVFESPRAGAGL
jgi:starch synthase